LNHASFPNGISEDDAESILRADVSEAVKLVEMLVKVPLTQGQFDALVDFCFNLGAAKLTASTLLKFLNHGRYDDAAEQLLRWDHAGGHEIDALRARREAEAELWRSAQPQHRIAA